MKIVHVLPSLARGGGERLTIELANRQVEAGQDVALVVGSALPAELAHGGLDPRVEAHFITSDRGRLRYRAMLPWIWRNRSWLASRDVLHCHLTYGALFAEAFRRLAGVTRPAIVETYHAVGMPIPRWLRALHARLASGWDGLTMMVDDPYWRDFSQRHPQIVSRVIPVGVEAPPKVSTSAARAYRESLAIPEDARIVTSIGRLVAERRPRSYVPVFAQVAEAMGRDIHFLMGGEGPEREAIEADAKEAGLADRLHLPGLVTEIELPLAVSDLYVTANVGPVPGVAGLQAVAAGIPVVALQLRGDYAAGPGDWIWSSSDAREIASKAVELLRDPSASGVMAKKQAVHLSTHHSAPAMAAAYEEFYRDAIANARLG
jgi:glycosyltransferase involved in cell wall biosynthesis